MAEKRTQNRIRTITGANDFDLEHYINELPKIVSEQKSFQAALNQATDKRLDNNLRIGLLAEYFTNKVKGYFKNDELTMAYFVIHEPDEEHSYEHYHFVFQLYNKHELSEWQKSLPMVNAQIKKLVNRKNAINDLLAYLIHAQSPAKKQINPEDVYTVAGKPYIDIYNENKDKWQKVKLHRATQELLTPEELDYIYNQILDGELKRKDFGSNRKLATVYAAKRRLIDDAFNARQKLVIEEYRKKKAQGLIHPFALYITGDAGIGKSYFCQDLKDMISNLHFNQLGEEITWYPVPQSGDPAGQCDGDERGWHFDDTPPITALIADTMKTMIKITEDEEVKAVKSRYFDKYTTHDYTIVSSTYDFFAYHVGAYQSLDQFIRRYDYVLILHFKQGLDNPKPSEDTLEIEWFRPIKYPKEQEQIINYDKTDLRDIRLAIPKVKTKYGLEFLGTLSCHDSLRKLITLRAIQNHMPVTDNYVKDGDFAEIHALFEELYTTLNQSKEVKKKKQTAEITKELWEKL